MPERQRHSAVMTSECRGCAAVECCSRWHVQNCWSSSKKCQLHPIETGQNHQPHTTIPLETDQTFPTASTLRLTKKPPTAPLAKILGTNPISSPYQNIEKPPTPRFRHLCINTRLRHYSSQLNYYTYFLIIEFLNSVIFSLNIYKPVCNYQCT